MIEIGVVFGRLGRILGKDAQQTGERGCGGASVSRRLFSWQRTVTLPDQNTFPVEGLRVAERRLISV